MPESNRYSAVAIVLHWAIAAAISLNLGIGWWMHDAIDVSESRAQAIAAFQLHKSIGFVVLGLSVLRLLWRFTHKPPPLPASMRLASRRAATAVHWLLYTLMILVPMSGWVLVSTQWRGDSALNVPTLWFGLFEIPHLFGLNEYAADLRAGWAESAFSAHEVMANLTALLFLGHVGAALQHHFSARDDVLARMVPVSGHPGQSLAARSVAERRLLITARIVIAAAVSWVLVALIGGPAVPDAQLQVGSTNISSSKEGWAVDSQASYIQFSGAHAGVAFTGRFRRWHSNGQLNPEFPEQSSVTVDIDTGSAHTGISLNDTTLKEPEWFDVANYPAAYFRTTSFEREGENWRISGELTIKDRIINITGLRMDLQEHFARISGEVGINRAAVDLGMESDPAGEWVSDEIVVKIEAQFRR